MKNLAKKSIFAYTALAVSMMVEAHAAAISGLSANQISNNTTQLRISFDGQPVTPVAHQQAGSNQLMLDFNQTTSSGLPRTMPINRGVVNTVTALNSGSLTRLMVGLNGAASYTSAVEGNQLLINVMSNTASSVAAPMMNSPVAQPTSSRPVQPAVQQGQIGVSVNPLLAPSSSSLSNNYNGISSINYSGKGKGGNITVALANEAIPVDVQRQGNKIVIRTQGTTIPRHLLRRINAGGLVSSIDAVNQGQSGVITISMSSDYEYQAYQSGASLHISVLPPKPMREPTIEEKTYTGEPLSMEFQDVSVRTVLDVLGQFTNNNIVAADNVTGNITLRLINVPWDQALDIILKSKNLGKRQNGNVILVAPIDELEKAEDDVLKKQAERKKFLPLRTEYVRLNYAKAAEVMKLIDDANRGNRGEGISKTALLDHPDGVVTSDPRTNTIIIKDSSEGIQNIRALIDKIDIPVKQVMIEARIVNANENFSKEIGVKWGSTKGSSTNPFSTKTGSPTNLAVNLGSAAGTSAAFQIGLLSISDMLLDLTLSAMQTERRGEVISAPKILTADKQKAKI